MLHSPASQQTAGCPCSVLPTVPTVVVRQSERERGVRPSLLLLPSPLSLSLPTLLHYQPLPHYLPIQLRYCIYPLPPQTKVYPAFAGPDPRHNHHHYSSHFFFTLNGLDSVILSSSMLFFHSRDRDCSHGRATSHLCLLEHHR